MTTLAALLREKRGEILLAWERSAGGDASLTSLEAAGPALRAHIPKLLDAIIEALENGFEDDEAHTGRNVARALLPHTHAKERLDAGYSLTAVLREIAHLREHIVDAVWQAGAGAELDPRGIRFVHAALDECMTIAAVAVERAEADDRERFVAVLGHDLRTPLNAVKMAGALLLGAGMAQEHALLAQKIVRAADRMNRMIGDLLDFAALRSGALSIEKKPCDLRGVCAEIIDEVRLAHRGRVVNFDCDGDCEGTWDAQRMAQAISNLVSNAIAYSPANTPVEVKVRADGPMVDVEVHNAGDPIPREEHANIFAPFKRKQQKRKSNDGGIGLGLFIAHQMVRAHEGDISLHSEPTEGTTFVVHVPRWA